MDEFLDRQNYIWKFKFTLKRPLVGVGRRRIGPWEPVDGLKELSDPLPF